MSNSEAVKRLSLKGNWAMKITRSGECKNSPKNAFVEDFVVDLLAGKDLSGRMEGVASLAEGLDGLTEIEIAHAISHGKVGAANGTIKAGGSARAFAVVIEFTSTKGTLVRHMDLYWAAHSP